MGLVWHLYLSWPQTRVWHLLGFSFTLLMCLMVFRLSLCSRALISQRPGCLWLRQLRHWDLHTSNQSTSGTNPGLKWSQKADLEIYICQKECKSLLTRMTQCSILWHNRQTWYRVSWSNMLWPAWWWCLLRWVRGSVVFGLPFWGVWGPGRLSAFLSGAFPWLQEHWPILWVKSLNGWLETESGLKDYIAKHICMYKW